MTKKTYIRWCGVEWDEAAQSDVTLYETFETDLGAEKPTVPAQDKEQRWRVWERDDFRCRQCGSRRFLTIDHSVPRLHGGTDEDDNLQTLCRSCNSKKGAQVCQSN